jgi:glycine dehydrogenase subunit 2
MSQSGTEPTPLTPKTPTGSGTSDLSFVEPVIFELGSAGRTGASIPASTSSRTDDAGGATMRDFDPQQRLGSYARQVPAGLPEVSEPEVFRHYVRLSQYNFAIDKGFYPLGSCTMKYNPKVNEWAARLAGFAGLHPYAPEELVQGALELMFRLERGLAEVCGMDRVSLHPAAGAQGELTGLMMIRAYHQSQGRSPKKVLVPSTAHGTNPASCALNGLETVPFSVADAGIIHPDDVRALIDDDVAAIMITNPSTVGLFETHLPTIANMVHERGGLVYGDGANLNALMGRARPGDLGVDVMQFNLHKTFTTPHGGGGPGCGPVGYKKLLSDFAPTPTVEQRADGSFGLEFGRPKSIGRLRSFHGNFGMMVRAYAYLREMGAEGLKAATDLAVLNANYLRVLLGQTWQVAFDAVCMHEVLISDQHLKATGVTTLDVAKRLLDYGFHAPTVYFPLVVKGAMLIEPTETETKQTLDQFVDAMKRISDEARHTPATVQSAPHHTRLRRLDETRAARKPVLRWQASRVPER